MNEPFISVIVPTLNMAKTLPRTLQSLREQGSIAIQTIVVDGGSTDSTEQILAEYDDVVSEIVVQSDRGISRAFNEGLAAASGEWIGILNADDYYQSAALEPTLQVASPRTSLIAASVRMQDSDSSYVLRPRPQNLHKRMSIYHPALLVRASAYQEVGGYNENYRYAMDSEWVHRAIANELRITVSDRVLANMSLGGRSDVNYRAALAEYRQSSVKHGLCGPIRAQLYFWQHLLVKQLSKQPLCTPIVERVLARYRRDD